METRMKTIDEIITNIFYELIEDKNLKSKVKVYYQYLEEIKRLSNASYADCMQRLENFNERYPYTEPHRGDKSDNQILLSGLDEQCSDRVISQKHENDRIQRIESLKITYDSLNTARNELLALTGNDPRFLSLPHADVIKGYKIEFPYLNTSGLPFILARVKYRGMEWFVMLDNKEQRRGREWITTPEDVIRKKNVGMEALFSLINNDQIKSLFCSYREKLARIQVLNDANYSDYMQRLVFKHNVKKGVYPYLEKDAGDNNLKGADRKSVV